MRSRSAGAIPRSCMSPSIRSVDSVSFSGASETRLVRGRGAAHDGRASKRSGRARQRSKIGAPLEKPRTYSSRSSIVGSAQWMSSIATTSGRDAASVSKSRRNAHAVSSGEPGSSFAPIAPRMRRVATGPRSTFARSASRPASGSAPATSPDDVGEREVGDALAVRNAASDHDARLDLERARGPRARDETCRYPAARRSWQVGTTSLAPPCRTLDGARRALRGDR